MLSVPEYHLIRLDPLPQSLTAAQECRDDYRRQYDLREPPFSYACEIRFLQKGQVQINHAGIITCEEGSVRTVIAGVPGEEIGITPVILELFVRFFLLEPPQPITEERVAVWQNNIHEAILPTYVTDPAVCERLAGLLRELADLTESKSVTRDLKQRTLLYDCFAVLTECAVNTVQNRQRLPQRVVSHYTSKACRFLENKISERPTVLAVAEYVGISYDYLKRVFQKDMGMTLKEYANFVKIRRVEQLITVENMTLEAAGSAVGIENLKYLSRLFIRFAGVSAAEYRRLYKQNQKNTRFDT